MSEQKSFYFDGIIPASKSMMNRALICSSYSMGLTGNSSSVAGLDLEGQSSCDDVVKMQKAIELIKCNLKKQQQKPSSAAPLEYDCGAAGTVLRFLSLRLSRIPGTHILKGTERLMQRPQQDLLDLFTRLGVKYELNKTQMILHSAGWKNLNEPLLVQRNVSSQFASGVILNAWNLEEDLQLKMVGDSTSEGYLEMTLQMVESLGMRIKREGSNLVILANSQVTRKQYRVESDISSLFAVASFSVLNGESIFREFILPSLQPDIEFLEFFKKMRIPFQIENQKLKIFPVESFRGLEANLNNCPDLFPVLAVLCSQASSPTRLFGAPQLVYKESNRIAKVAELLNLIHIKNTPTNEGILIEPATKESSAKASVTPFVFDTDHDHRLAFAAAIVRSLGYPIQILHPEVVNKSFPEFWKVVGVNP